MVGEGGSTVTIYGQIFGGGVCSHRKVVCDQLLEQVVNCFLMVDKLFISESLSGLMNDNLLSSNMTGSRVVVLLVALWVMSSKVSKVDFWFGYLWGQKQFCGWGYGCIYDGI